jgi:hypothetical protein
MTDTAPVAAEESRGPGLLGRIVGVIFSPRATYTAIVARPTVLGVLAVTLLIGAGLGFWLLTSEAGQHALASRIEESIRQQAAQGRDITAQQRQAMQVIVKVIGYVGAVASVVLMPGILALLALILRAILNFAYGVRATFRQAFAVVAHSWVIATIASLFSTPLMYFKEDLVSPTRVGVLLPMLPEKGLATSFLNAVDFWHIWWICNLAIGLAVLYKGRTVSIAGVMLGLYACLALLIAVVRS